MGADIKMEPNVESLPAADITLSHGPEGLIQTESYPVLPHKESQNDYMVPIKISSLRRFKQKLEQIKDSKFQLDELFLAVSTLLLGSSISALASKVSIDTTLGIWLLVVFPIIGFSSLVATIMLKIMNHRIKKITSQDILSEIEGYLKE